MEKITKANPGLLAAAKDPENAIEIEKERQALKRRNIASKKKIGGKVKSAKTVMESRLRNLARAVDLPGPREESAKDDTGSIDPASPSKGGSSTAGEKTFEPRAGEAVGLMEDFSCQIVVDETLDWLSKSDSDRPFFIYAAFHEPHEPIASPLELVQSYASSARNENEAQYFANVANVDAAVGKLVAGLERLQRRDNTLIVFTSDNGPETLNRYRGAARSYGRPGPLRGMKLHTSDAGFRVAGIMNWKGKIPPRTEVVSVPVSALDLLPTFCILAEAPLPVGAVLDGTSFLPALEGKPLSRDKPLVWVYFNAINQTRVAMRDGKWKVLAKLDGGKLPKMPNVTRETAHLMLDAELTDVEIYDLTADIHESVNLADENPQRTTELKAKLEQQYRELVKGSHVW